MSVEELLDELEDVVESATSLAFGGKCIVNGKQIKTIIENIRLNTPQEIKHAKNIVDERSRIVSAAEKEAASILKKAQDEAVRLVAGDEITKTAQAQANQMLGEAKAQAGELLADAHGRSKEIMAAAASFADDVLRQADEELFANLSSVRKVRQNLKNARLTEPSKPKQAALDLMVEEEETAGE